MKENESIKLVHINQIEVGDTVRYNGNIITVGKKDLCYSQFMGKSLFGDNFQCGYKKVELVIIEKAMPLKKSA